MIQLKHLFPTKIPEKINNVICTKDCEDLAKKKFYQSIEISVIGDVVEHRNLRHCRRCGTPRSFLENPRAHILMPSMTPTHAHRVWSDI